MVVMLGYVGICSLVRAVSGGCLVVVWGYIDICTVVSVGFWWVLGGCVEVYCYM